MKNPVLHQLIQDLKKQSIDQKVKLWKRVAVELEKGTRRRRAVTVEHIKKNTKAGETAVVPGKVLGKEKADVPIAAFQWSAGARNENTIMSLRELMKKNPKAQKCRIIG